MTSNRNLGHGICGFKNEYSTNVKMGNWVEDKIGQTIVDSGPRPGKLDYLTEYSANHNDQHSTRCSTASTSSPMAISVEELKLKNKEGLSYNLLIAQDKDFSRNERYKTTAQLNEWQDLKFNIPEGYKQRQKAKMLKRDLSLAYDKTTEYRAATAQMKVTSAPNAVPYVAIGRSDNLPVWRRRRMLDYK